MSAKEKPVSTISKSKKAYYRKLYLAYLIESGRHNLITLEEETGMPRRTIETAMAGFSDIGIIREFVQDGPKNKQGYYRITEWSDHRKSWIKDNIKGILQVLQGA